MRFFKFLTTGVLATFLMISFASATPSKKTKFYNFDELMIDGKVKKPQILYIDNKQKVKFQKLLNLKKCFLPKLKDTNKDPSLR